MKVLRRSAAFIALIAIVSGCSKDMVSPASSGLNGRAKKINSGPVTVLSISPASGITYTAVTITGSNFDTVKTNNSVKINGVTALVNSATATQLVVTVLPGTSTGTVTVTTGGNSATVPGNFKVLNYVRTGSINQDLNNLVQALAFDKNGNIYGVISYLVGKVHHPTIFKYLNKAAITTLYKSPNDTVTNGINGYHNSYSYTMPAGLVIDSHGNIYTALVQSNYTYSVYPIKTVLTTTILKTTPQGVTTILADSVDGQPIGGQLIGKMCIDVNDNIYFIADGSSGSALDNSVIYKITPAGAASTFFNSPIQLWGGIAVDQSGNADVSIDPAAGISVEQITPQGNTSIIAGPYQNASAFFSIFFDQANNLIGADGQNHILIINGAGYASLFTLALFDSNLFIDQTGNMYGMNSSSEDIIKYSLQ